MLLHGINVVLGQLLDFRHSTDTHKSKFKILDWNLYAIEIHRIKTLRILVRKWLVFFCLVKCLIKCLIKLLIRNAYNFPMFNIEIIYNSCILLILLFIEKFQTFVQIYHLEQNVLRSGWSLACWESYWSIVINIEKLSHGRFNAVKSCCMLYECCQYFELISHFRLSETILTVL